MSAEINLEKKFEELFPRLSKHDKWNGERPLMFETYISIFEAGFREGMEAEATCNKEIITSGLQGMIDSRKWDGDDKS